MCGPRSSSTFGAVVAGERREERAEHFGIKP